MSHFYTEQCNDFQRIIMCQTKQIMQKMNKDTYSNTPTLRGDSQNLAELIAYYETNTFNLKTQHNVHQHLI